MANLFLIVQRVLHIGQSLLTRLLHTRTPAMCCQYLSPYEPRLESLPTELVLCIGQYLSPETNAALALTSCTMLQKLGHGTLQLDSTCRYKLLLLLSKDGMYLPDVLCPFCRIFHSPLPKPTWAWEHWEWNMRVCEDMKLAGWGHCEGHMLLPRQVHFNTVAAVLRCARHNSTAFKASMLDSCNKIQRFQSKVHIYYDFRIADGHLLLRTEKYILPSKNANETLGALPVVRETMKDNPYKLDGICFHHVWTWEQPGVFDTPKCPNIVCIGPRNPVCAWTHKRCICYASWVKIVECRFCYTDYRIRFVDLPDGGARVCVLTTWKDFGPGESNDDPEWRSHTIYRRKTEPIRGSKIGGGPICKAFEKKSPSKYRPAIPRRTLEDFAS